MYATWESMTFQSEDFEYSSIFCTNQAKLRNVWDDFNPQTTVHDTKSTGSSPFPWNEIHCLKITWYQNSHPKFMKLQPWGFDCNQKRHKMGYMNEQLKSGADFDVQCSCSAFWNENSFGNLDLSQTDKLFSKLQNFTLATICKEH